MDYILEADIYEGCNQLNMLEYSLECIGIDENEFVNEGANIKEKINPSMRYRKQLQIEAICVDEKTRGKGIGTQLLKHIKQYGKENDCTDIYLTVNEENVSAIKMYEEFGFKVKSIAYSMQI